MLAAGRPAVGAPSRDGAGPVSTVSIDVPYLPQTPALCGGAAVAMLFRYWGDRRADVEQFAPLVDRRAGGIATDVLTQAVKDRQWEALVLRGSIDVIRHELGLGHPLILLVEDRPNRYHYLVAVAADADRVWLHDPTWGPSRIYPVAELLRRWEPAQFWALLVLPGREAALDPSPSSEPQVGRGPLPGPGELVPPQTADAPCDRALASAVAEIRVSGLDAADGIFEGLQSRCPTLSEPISELAGVRFAQRRFDDAATLAERAIDRNPTDAYAWDVLGSSRFVRNDLGGALQAWNRVDKPRFDSVRIQGLAHTRYALVAQMLGLTPGALLDQERYRRAERRLEQLPGILSARIDYRPQSDGLAIVDVAVLERPRTPSGALGWGSAAAHALVNREVEMLVPGWSGQGEMWMASWRWWEERPRVAFAFTAPRAGAWPGVWRVEGFQETQTYAATIPGSRLRETRMHAGVGVTDWITSKVRYELTAGADSWEQGRKSFSTGVTLERRWFGDRLAVSGAFQNGLQLQAAAKTSGLARPPDEGGFRSLALHTAVRSSTASNGFVHLADLHTEVASGSSPLALWPGAGDGHGRPSLLRAHPLIDGGVIDGLAFGRRLVALNLESRRWLERPAIARIGLAAFADLVKAGARLPGAVGDPFQVDAGVGLRLRIPGQDGTLRVDVARGLRDGRQAITIGYTLEN